MTDERPTRMDRKEFENAMNGFLATETAADKEPQDQDPKEFESVMKGFLTLPATNQFLKQFPGNQLPQDTVEYSFENGRMKVVLPRENLIIYWTKLKKVMDLALAE